MNKTAGKHFYGDYRPEKQDICGNNISLEFLYYDNSLKSPYLRHSGINTETKDNWFKKNLRVGLQNLSLTCAKATEFKLWLRLSM